MGKQTLLQKGAGPSRDLITYCHIDPSVIRKRVGEVTDDAVVVELWGQGTSAYAPVLGQYGGAERYLSDLAKQCGVPSFRRWCLTAWSAGGQFAKSVCAVSRPEDWPDAIVLLDAVYGKKPPGSRRGDGLVVMDAGIMALVAYAIEAARAERTMVLFHSRIGTAYASTKECCEAIQRRVEAELGQAMGPSVDLTAEDLDGHRFVEALSLGNLHLVEFAGVDADEHVTEAHLYDEVWQKLLPWSRRATAEVSHPPAQPADLQQGSRGPEVVRWQLFLIGQGFNQSKADGDFGPKTTDGTKRFQARYGLPQTGVVDAATRSVAAQEGLPKPLPAPVTDDAVDEHKKTAAWPSPPAYAPLVGTAERQRVFGAFRYVSAPEPSNPEAIRILDDWDDRNIVRVTVPELGGIAYAPKDGAILFHHKGADQLLALFRAWGEAGLMKHVKSWAGSYVPRFIRGSRTTLSNHAFGTAFDINAPQNPLGATPALVGADGSVRELVPLANAHGFYWGGHFRGRPDGMHFELAVPGMQP